MNVERQLNIMNNHLQHTVSMFLNVSCKCSLTTEVPVVVNFLSQVILILCLLFLNMAMSAIEVEKKEK